jgi:transposase
MTCWRRLRDWQQADLWNRLHRLLLEKLSYADQSDWSRVCVDASCVPAPKGGRRPAPIPPTEGKPATKHHLATAAQGIPLGVKQSAANCNETTLLEQMIEALPPLARKRGRPKWQPGKVHTE